MISKHHEHSFDLDLMKPGDWALDVGCRGFAIPFGLSDHQINVIAVEADPAIVPPPNTDRPEYPIRYLNAAVVHRELAANKKVTLWKHPHDQQAHSIIRHGGNPVAVDTISIPALMERFGLPQLGVSQFALIKLDCEGAEYRLMHDIADAAAGGEFWGRQISVEYHDHCGLNPQGDVEAWYRHLHQRLSPFYEVAKHAREVPPWNGPAHYVDSLYILRKEFWR